MRLLLLTQLFDPEPAFKGLVLAKKWQRLGHDVEILTGFPNYPTGTIYEGYHIKLFQREYLEGIPVLRVPIYPSHDGSSLRRLANYASFALSASILGPLLVQRPDVVFINQGPVTIAWPAAVLKWLRGARLVFDVVDLWPDSLAATTMIKNRHLLKIVDIWCNLMYRIADQIVVVSPGLKAKLEERGVPQSKVKVIYNWADERQLPKAGEDQRLEPGMSGRFNIVFAGNIGLAQALDAVLDSAKILKTACPVAQFVFVGGGVDVERLQERARQEALDNVVFLPRRPSTEIGFLLAQADALLVHLKDEPLFRITIPSKTQGYMAIGRPVLMAVAGDAENLVKEAGAGISCQPENPASIAQAVQTLVEMAPERLQAMGDNGKAFYCRELSLEMGARKLSDLFAAILNAS